MEGGFGSPQDWPAVPAQAQGEVPWLEGGRSHGNHCSPSVASRQPALCPWTHSIPTEGPDHAGRVCAPVCCGVGVLRGMRVHGVRGCWQACLLAQTLVPLDSSCLIQAVLLPSWVALGQ